MSDQTSNAAGMARDAAVGAARDHAVYVEPVIQAIRYDGPPTTDTSSPSDPLAGSRTFALPAVSVEAPVMLGIVVVDRTALADSVGNGKATRTTTREASE